MRRLIFLWCHPRSMSSALERAMLERGDMATLHEPFLYLYYVHDARKRLPHLDVDRQRPTSYEGIRAMVLETARTRPVFVKDMCYYIVDHIHDDVEFVQRMTSTFLVRDPAQSIPSYYRLDPGVTLEEIGCEAQYRCFERFAEVTGTDAGRGGRGGSCRGPGRHRARILPGRWNCRSFPKRWSGTRSCRNPGGT